MKFSDIYLQYQFHPYVIDIQAAVKLGTTDRMIQGAPVTKEQAQKVLSALTRRTAQDYSLFTVDVNVFEDVREVAP